MNIQEFERNTKSLSVTNIPEENIDLSIGHYGYEISDSNKKPVAGGGEGIPTFRVHYIVHGNITLYVRGKEIRLGKNQCFLLRPDIDISYRTDKISPASFYWVSFTGKNTKNYLNQMGFGETSFYINIPPKLQKKLHNAFFANFTVSRDKIDLTDAIFMENFMKIVQFLYLSSNVLRKADGGLRNKSKLYIEQALEYINEHYTDSELTIKEIAHKLFVHENYLSHIFKEEMGTSFREYLTQKRIEASASLMKQNYTSVKQIAAAVGYSDPLYFSKVFKKYNGTCPKEQLEKIRTKKYPPPRERFYSGRRYVNIINESAQNIGSARIFTFHNPSSPFRYGNAAACLCRTAFPFEFSVFAPRG